MLRCLGFIEFFELPDLLPASQRSSSIYQQCVSNCMCVRIWVALYFCWMLHEVSQEFQLTTCCSCAAQLKAASGTHLINSLISYMQQVHKLCS